MAANEASSIGSLRTIVTAQSQFLSTGTNLVSNVPQYGNLTELASAVPPFIDTVLGASNTPTKSGYTFSFSLTTGSAPAFGMQGNASSARTGSRDFFIDNSGVLTWEVETDGPADSDSNPLQ